MIKVLYILDSLNRGGAEVLALDICHNAAANGIDSCLVACGGGDLEDEFTTSRFDYIRLQRKSPLDLRLVFALRNIVKTKGIDIVHVQQPVEALHGYLATRGLGIKLVFTYPGWFQDGKSRAVVRFLAPRFDANIAVSQDTKCWLEQKGVDTKKNFHVIANGVDQKRLECETRNLRKELNLAAGDLLVGMLANFYPGVRKDHQTVCRAIAALKATHPQTHAVFIGGKFPSAPQIFDDCVRLCEELGISDRVHFLGKRAEIPDILSSLDIFVLSSLHEGLPIALVAAMIVGLPCVASDIPPHREISGGGKFVRLFETGNPASLAEVFRQLLNDPAARHQLGAEARRFALNEFSIEAHLAKLRNLYQSLLN